MSKIWGAITSAEMLIVCQLSARNWQLEFFLTWRWMKCIQKYEDKCDQTLLSVVFSWSDKQLKIAWEQWLRQCTLTRACKDCQRDQQELLVSWREADHTYSGDWKSPTLADSSPKMDSARRKKEFLLLFHWVYLSRDLLIYNIQKAILARFCSLVR